MNHPLVKFHRPRSGAGLRDSARGQMPAHRPQAGIRLVGQSTVTEHLPDVPGAAKTALPRRTEVHPTNASPPPPEKPRRRWYQYSLRTLFLLTLIVSLFMSWHAVKLKQAMIQKKAVEAILAADGTVEYDFQFDEQGIVIKGAQGHGPGWLRDLLGPDYFDTVVHVDVASAKGMEAVNRLPRLRSLTITLDDKEHPLDLLQDINGLEELAIYGDVTDAELDHVRGLKHLRRLELRFGDPLQVGGPVSTDNAEKKQFAGPSFAVLESSPTLRELIIQDYYDAPAVVLRGIETLSALEQLTLAPANLRSSDIQSLGKLPALRELDLAGCSKIDDDAVPYLQKMKGLKRLGLWGTGITDEGAEKIDDALPDCHVIY